MEGKFKTTKNPKTNPTSQMMTSNIAKGNQGEWKMVHHKKYQNSKMVEHASSFIQHP